MRPPLSPSEEGDGSDEHLPGVKVAGWRQGWHPQKYLLPHLHLQRSPWPQGRCRIRPVSASACFSRVSWQGCSSPHRCSSPHGCQAGQALSRHGGTNGFCWEGDDYPPRESQGRTQHWEVRMSGDEDERTRCAPSPMGGPSSSPALGARTFCCPTARGETVPPLPFGEESECFGG